MVRAAATGAIDFSRADPNDRWWWKRTNFILDEVARRDRLEWLRANAQHYAGIMANSRLDNDSFQKTQEGSLELVNSVYKVLFPWQSDVSLQQDLVETWTSTFGDINSPETQEMIEKAIEAIYAVPVNVEDVEE